MARGVAQGAELVKKTNLNAVFVFVAPPSYEELERRLRGRGTENEETLKTRLANAQGELAYMYKPRFFDCVIINDGLVAWTRQRPVKGALRACKVS